MENPVKKYQLEQDGKTYTLLTQIYQDRLRFVCIEANSIKSLVFTGEFTLSDLIEINQLFTSITSISQTQDLFDKIITNQKVSIESQGNYINLTIMLIKDNNIEEKFTLRLNLFTDNQTNQEPIQETQINENQIKINPPQNILFSFSENNNGQENMEYTTTNENITPEQYISQQLQSNENINHEYNYESKQIHKTKKTKIDKFTLSLRPLPQGENNANYLREWVKSLSPQKKEETEITQKTSVVQQQQINTEPYIAPKNENNESNIVETNTNITSYQQLYPINPQPEIQTIQKTEIISKEQTIELENLKNENNKLNEIIIQLKKQIEILVRENNDLKLKNNHLINNMPNGDEEQKYLFLKEDNERNLKEIELLKNQLIQFEEYKKIKEEEILYLKMQIEELIQNLKKLKEYVLQKEKEIKELKLFNEDLIRQHKVYESYLLKNKNNNMNLEDDMLTIQDTRLEIVKGDIIQNVKELELLSRKISKNNQKITLNLLYKATIDSDKAEAFHKKCDSAKSTLVLVKSENGKRFGGYTTRDWRGNSVEKKDNNAFVFSLDKMAIYDIIPGEDAIGCYPKYGPIFLGCQIRIYDEFFSQGGTTFEKGMNYETKEDYELTGGLKKFDVKEIEVYSVELE